MLKAQHRQLKDLIAKGRLDKAIEALSTYAESLPDPHYFNSITQIAARWKANERAQLLGTLSNDDYGRERNKINHAVLVLMDEMVEETPETKVEPVSDARDAVLPDSTPKTDLWKKIGYIGLILGILASMVKLIEFCSKPTTDKAMQLTVFVQGEDKKPIDALQNTGRILVRYGNASPEMLIGQGGRCNFGEIPSEKRNQEVDIILIAEGYEPVFPAKKYVMDGKPVYFPVQRDNSLGNIHGIVKDRSGEKFIEGALIMINNDTTTLTDALGRFRLQLPLAKHDDTYYLTAKKDGFKTKNEYFKPKTGPIEIRLDKK